MRVARLAGIQQAYPRFRFARGALGMFKVIDANPFVGPPPHALWPLIPDGKIFANGMPCPADSRG
jgi:hypothetical protein